MIERHLQLFRHDPENGVYGDCFRTVIACLLRLPPVDVPHVAAGEITGDESNAMMRAWLAERGHRMIEFPLLGEMSLEDVLHWGAAYSEGLHWMLSGKSRNGCGHVVICHGNQIVHDTSIDQSGIVGPSEGGFWWIGWLVRPAPCDEAAS